MVVNQLFSVVPPFTLFIKILNCFGLENAKDKHGFTIDTMNSLNTIEKMKNIENEIKQYYVPCKVKIFFNNWDHKSSITILRQFARLYGYDIPSKEKFINHRKILIYRIITKIPKERTKKSILLKSDNSTNTNISSTSIDNSDVNNNIHVPTNIYNSNTNIENTSNIQTNLTPSNLAETNSNNECQNNSNNQCYNKVDNKVDNKVEKISRKIRKKQIFQMSQKIGFSNSDNDNDNSQYYTHQQNQQNQQNQQIQQTQKINKEYIVNFD